MFAVLKTGGRQFRVTTNDVIKVHKLNVEPGATLDLDSVLMVGDEKSTKIGTPFVKGAKVTVSVVAQDRAEKVIIFKRIQRETYRRKKGHRQDVTVLKVTGISA